MKETKYSMLDLIEEIMNKANFLSTIDGDQETDELTYRYNHKNFLGISNRSMERIHSAINWAVGRNSENIRDVKTGDFITYGDLLSMKNDIEKLMEEYTSFIYDEMLIDLDKINLIISKHQDQYDKFVQQNKRRDALGEDSSYGYVYIIKVDQYYKIGQTANLKKRIGEYTKLMKEPEIIINAKCHYYKEIEKDLHKMFEDKRSNGEWFILSDEDLNKAVVYLKERARKFVESKDSEKQTA